MLKLVSRLLGPNKMSLEAKNKGTMHAGGPRICLFIQPFCLLLQRDHPPGEQTPFALHAMEIFVGSMDS